MFREKSCLKFTIMGGMLVESGQGQVDGRKEGVGSDDSLYALCERLNLETEQTEYWLGFGAGYYEGQMERQVLKDENDHLTLDQKVEYYRFILRRSFLDRNEMASIYLDNIQFWHVNKIPKSVCEKSVKFLESGEIQRAIHEIGDYYRSNFYLQAEVQMDNLSQDLQKMRVEKRNSKDFDTSVERNRIEADLRAWILHHQTEEMV